MLYAQIIISNKYFINGCSDPPLFSSILLNSALKYEWSELSGNEFLQVIYTMTVIHAFPFSLWLSFVLVQKFLYKLNSPKEDIWSVLGFTPCFSF